MVREEYITDELVVKRAKAAVAIELEKKRALDLPAVVYDPTTESIYHVYSDGTRVASGGHDVPMEKIISRYDRALDLLGEVVTVCDICHIYDNSGEKPFRIFKKRKEKCFYEECNDWRLEDIQLITGINYMEQKELN